MWKKIKKLTDFVIVALFVVFIYGILAMTYTGPVQKAVEGTKYNFDSYKSLSKKFEGILQKNLYMKYDFINLNGRVARHMRIHSLNHVQRLKNGFLTEFPGAKEITEIDEFSQKVVSLNDFLADRGIPFIYMLAPRKNSMYDAQFAPGYGIGSKQNITKMIDALAAAGVNTINMDEWFEKNGWHMKDVFFKTDHHWRPEAGLAAARCAMDMLQKKGVAKYDEKKLREKSYKKEVLRRWFLGSSGKRTGIYFGGLDNITVYHPKFKTKYSYAGLRSKSTNWEYSDSLLDMSYTEKKEYFTKNPYDIYMHRDYPIRNTVNTAALNKKRLLLMGDSFKMMSEYFFATQYREVYTIDLRYYTDGTFAQYFEEIKPDVVIMCSNANGITSKKLNAFGVEEYLAALKQPLGPAQFLGDMELRAEEKNKNKFAVVCGNLEPNQAYTLTVDRTALSGAENSFVQMTLQNLSKNKAIYNRYFESGSKKVQKWIFTTPEKPEDAYGIYLYAGTKGHTAGIDVKVEGIRLRKGIFED